MQREFSFQSVQPVKPAAPWMGGKKKLAQRIASIIEQIPHSTYAEPFVGMGGVFFRRSLVPRMEVVNDFSGDVVNLFRILQRHYPQLMDTMKFQITSRREFERLVACDPATLTDLERAARFIYLQRTSFGGKVRGQNFGVIHDGPARFNLNSLGPVLEDIHERLGGVIIENLRWQDFIGRYDRPGVLFYLDPPYFGNEDDYGKGLFGRSEFSEMAGLLAGIEGRFVLSLNDREEVRAIFSRFRFMETELTYSVGGGAGTGAKELVIVDRKEPALTNGLRPGV